MDGQSEITKVDQFHVTNKTFMCNILSSVVKMIVQFLKKFLNKFLLIFAKETTIHGIPLIVIPNIHLLERLFWLLAIILSLAGATSLTISNWNRYNANPTVVSIQKDYRNWLNILPSATGCFVRKADPDLVEDYINQTWGIINSDPKYAYYEDFVIAVANISYSNFDAFSPFLNDSSLSKVNLLELAAKVHPLISGTLVTFDPRRKASFKLVMTEMGICFAVNNKFSDVISFKVKGVDISKNVDESILDCHYLNGLCYARYDSDPTSTLHFYVHSCLDVLHATMRPSYYLMESEEFEINYVIQQTDADRSLRSLSPSQRKCRFDNEPLTNDVPIYSTSICYINCRYRLTLRLCGCKPFFYHFLPGKVCDVKGMLCVARHAKNITKPPSEIGCQCPQPCEMITYLPLAPKITIWKSGYFDQRITFRWGIMHPTTKYRREILFGFEDLVVSIGGTLALFLGVSFISLIEIVFFALEFIASVMCNVNYNENESEMSSNSNVVKIDKNPKDFIIYNNKSVLAGKKTFRIYVEPRQSMKKF